MVDGEYSEESEAHAFLAEIQTEANRFPFSIPDEWLSYKFRQLYLEAYVHNFTLDNPLKNNVVSFFSQRPVRFTIIFCHTLLTILQKFVGSNVYGILRAPRSASLEALVLTVPYRPPSSVYPSTIPGLALMFSLAKYFRSM